MLYQNSKLKKVDSPKWSLPIAVELLATIDGICIVCGPLADKTAAICCRWWNKCSLWFHCTRSRPTWISNCQKLSHNNLQFPPFYFFFKFFKTNNTPFYRSWTKNNDQSPYSRNILNLNASVKYQVK